jgi:hypothetical protein
MHALDHENLIRLHGIVLSQPMMMIGKMRSSFMIFLF